jgi:hypothetical protein
MTRSRWFRREPSSRLALAINGITSGRVGRPGSSSSFPVYRRVATMIFVPAESGSASTVEMVTIDPQDLQAAQELDLNHGA